MYIHIPFCVRKCNYCDFLSGPFDEAAREAYVEALLGELCASSKKFQGRRVKSIFFGGGTPSVLTVAQTGRIMNCIRANYHIEQQAEITTEANPGTLSMEKLQAYYGMGFNRLSIGLQSANNHELQMLGRIHTFEEFVREYESAVKAGFQNINIDLMSGIVDQTPASWADTLQSIVRLGPQHISAYSLILEEGTPLYELHQQGKLDGRLADEDEDREMYYRTREILEQYGYLRYEISNYAQKGCECRHNLTYWERGNYAGFGLGAASLMDNVRYKNTSDMKNYLKNSKSWEEIQEDREELSESDCMEEFMFLGLRKTAGIHTGEFLDIFGVDIKRIYGEVILRLIRQGLLLWENDRIFLTEKGLDVSNVVMAEFLL